MRASLQGSGRGLRLRRAAILGQEDFNPDTLKGRGRSKSFKADFLRQNRSKTVLRNNEAPAEVTHPCWRFALVGLTAQSSSSNSTPPNSSTGMSKLFFTTLQPP